MIQNLNEQVVQKEIVPVKCALVKYTERTNLPRHYLVRLNNVDVVENDLVVISSRHNMIATAIVDAVLEIDKSVLVDILDEYEQVVVDKKIYNIRYNGNYVIQKVENTPLKLQKEIEQYEKELAEMNDKLKNNPILLMFDDIARESFKTKYNEIKAKLTKAQEQWNKLYNIE